MTLRLVTLAVYLVQLIAFVHVKSTREDQPEVTGQKLIIILVDGVRWDYPDEPYIRGLKSIADNGVRAEFVQPVFPSNSYPNWYSIITGRYAENHGIVDNIMYDKWLNSYFIMGNDDERWWNRAEPLWITAQARGLQTSVLWWNGCHIKIKGTNVRECRKNFWYKMWRNVNRDFSKAMSEILDQMSEDKLQLAMSYYEAVDGEGHAYGPNSIQRKTAMRQIDSIIFDLQEEMTAKNLTDKVNLVIVSDHGMTNTAKSIPIEIKNLVSAGDIQYMVHGGAEAMILPYPGKLDKVYLDLKNANIKGLNVYKKDDIPEQYRIRNNQRTLPILLVADLGYSIKQLGFFSIFKNVPTFMPSQTGSHGYDPFRYEDMRTIFFARGPAFKTGFVGKPIRIVDEYNLFCEILRISPLPNDGDYSKIKDYLRN